MYFQNMTTEAVLVLSVVLFFIGREIVLWYFKIGEISENIKKISASLEKLSENQGLDFDSKVNLLKIYHSLNGINNSIKKIVADEKNNG